MICERSVSSVSAARSFCAATHTSAAAVTKTTSQDTFDANSQSLTCWVHTMLAATNVADECHIATVGAQMTHVLRTSKFKISISLSASVFFLDVASLCMAGKPCCVAHTLVLFKSLRCVQAAKGTVLTSVQTWSLSACAASNALSAASFCTQIQTWCHHIHRLIEHAVTSIAGQCCTR